MRDLNYELKQLCRRNRDGSYATQRDRERVLDLVANQLHDLGYRHLAAASPVSYTHLRAHETVLDPVCRLLLETKKN